MDGGAWWAAVHVVEESDTTERLYFHFSLSFIGEGNSNPLHCSCLENPRNGGACWAAVYGVTQSWTRLKRLSSSTAKGYSCLRNPMDRGAWWATVHGVAKSRTRLSDFTSLHFTSNTGKAVVIWDLS